MRDTRVGGGFGDDTFSGTRVPDEIVVSASMAPKAPDPNAGKPSDPKSPPGTSTLVKSNDGSMDFVVIDDGKSSGMSAKMWSPSVSTCSDGIFVKNLLRFPTP